MPYLAEWQRSESECSAWFSFKPGLRFRVPAAPTGSNVAFFDAYRRTAATPSYRSNTTATASAAASLLLGPLTNDALPRHRYTVPAPARRCPPTSGFVVAADCDCAVPDDRYPYFRYFRLARLCFIDLITRLDTPATLMQPTDFVSEDLVILTRASLTGETHDFLVPKSSRSSSIAREFNDTSSNSYELQDADDFNTDDDEHLCSLERQAVRVFDNRGLNRAATPRPSPLIASPEFIKAESLGLITPTPEIVKRCLLSAGLRLHKYAAAGCNLAAGLAVQFHRPCTSIASNLLPARGFAYAFKKRVVRLFDRAKFSITTVAWHYQVLARFLEACSGLRACIKFYPFLHEVLSLRERGRCELWSHRVKYYRRALGPKLFLIESLQLTYLFLKLKDPVLLTNWMVEILQRISFWKFKTFLRYIKYAIKNFFWALFGGIGVRGVRLQLKGKISVAGNARTRTASHHVGYTSHATLDNRVLRSLDLVRTFTGVQGLKIWIVF